MCVELGGNGTYGVEGYGSGVNANGGGRYYAMWRDLKGYVRPAEIGAYEIGLEGCMCITGQERRTISRRRQSE